MILLRYKKIFKILAPIVIMKSVGAYAPLF